MHINRLIYQREIENLRFPMTEIPFLARKDSRQERFNS